MCVLQKQPKPLTVGSRIMNKLLDTWYEIVMWWLKYLHLGCSVYGITLSTNALLDSNTIFLRDWIQCWKIERKYVCLVTFYAFPWDEVEKNPFLLFTCVEKDSLSLSAEFSVFVADSPV